MICVTLFCTLRESENTRTCLQLQKRATKSDTSGHCPDCNEMIEVCDLHLSIGPRQDDCFVLDAHGHAFAEGPWHVWQFCFFRSRHYIYISIYIYCLKKYLKNI